MIELTSLGDVIVGALQELLQKLFDPITKVIQNHTDELLKAVIGTKHPNAIFGPPTNGPWPEIYHYYWDMIVPLSLFLWAVAIGLVIFFESTSHLFSSYHRTKLKKRAFSGLLGILAWWWMAALSLRFMSALADVIVPSLSSVSMFDTLSFSAMGVLGTVIALSADFTLFVLIALIYLIREVVLYMFVLLMPILIALWIPGVGPLTLVSRFCTRLAGFYVPFLFMTIPVAILLRLGELLGSSVTLSMQGFGMWLTALVIPIVAVLSPIVLVWQAGAIFFAGNQAARHVSSSRARSRVIATRERGAAAAHGGRNFSQGARGEPAVTRDGQYLLSSGGSRAHAAGSRVHSASTHLRTVFDPEQRRRGGGPPGGSGGSRGGRDATDSTETSPTDASERGDGPATGRGAPSSRNTDFETLRERGSAPTRDDRDDDRPYYLN